MVDMLLSYLLLSSTGFLWNPLVWIQSQTIETLNIWHNITMCSRMCYWSNKLIEHIFHDFTSLPCGAKDKITGQIMLQQKNISQCNNDELFSNKYMNKRNQSHKLHESIQRTSISLHPIFNFDHVWINM